MELETLSVNGVHHTVCKLLGKGKGGYSYLVTGQGNQFSIDRPGSSLRVRR